MQNLYEVTDYKIRKFSPIDRETSIFEVMVDGNIIMDISMNEKSRGYEILFYESIVNMAISVELLNEMVRNGISAIESDL